MVGLCCAGIIKAVDDLDRRNTCTLHLELRLVYAGMQGISLELHSYLVSQVQESVYADQAMLPLDFLPAAFLQSCTQCAGFFAGVQQQVRLSSLPLQGLLLQGRLLHVLQFDCGPAHREPLLVL